MGRSLALLLVVVLAGAGTGCHAGEPTVTVYFEQRLGGAGPHGQVAPVLQPVARDRRAHLDAAWQALLELRQGPTPHERLRGFEPTLDLAARPLRVTVDDGTATVDLARPARFRAAAAIVYTLTELDWVERVGFRVDGRPCCLPLRDGTSQRATDRARYRFWSGEPCELRTDPTHARCRDDRN